MKRLIILFLCIFNLVDICANEQEFRDKLAEFSSTNRVIECDFTQETSVKNLKQSVVTYGKFYYDNSGKMALIYDSPEGNRVVMNGDQFTIVVNGRSVVSGSDSNPVLGHIAAMMRGCMGGDISQFTDGWSLGFEAEDSQYVITLTPESRRIKRYISSIIMYFECDDLTMNALVMNNASGGATSYTFTNKLLNVSIDPEVFNYE